MIFHPECKKGHHSINSPTKLQILNIYPAAPNGYAVEFKRFNNETFFEFFEGTYRNGEQQCDDYKSNGFRTEQVEVQE
jgi:hypothetical protein